MISLSREILQEDDDGSIQASIDDIVHKAKRRRLLESIGNVRLGMVMLVLVLLQFSHIPVFIYMTDQHLSILVC